MKIRRQIKSHISVYSEDNEKLSHFRGNRLLSLSDNPICIVYIYLCLYFIFYIKNF